MDGVHQPQLEQMTIYLRGEKHMALAAPMSPGTKIAIFSITLLVQ